MIVTAAIVDYGLGNLFSVHHACHAVGIDAEITSDKTRIMQADMVLLPGVGAYADAMSTLHRLDLVRPLQDIPASGRLLVGICLGQQLLMTESYEFGVHQGLGLIPGTVIRFDASQGIERPLKVPQIGWNRICPTRAWQDTSLTGIAEGEYMYFVHSYHTVPAQPDVTIATARYGKIEFCAALESENIVAFQFHPERSAQQGLQIYRNLMQRASQLREQQS